jgi:hypothetical protein
MQNNSPSLHERLSRPSLKQQLKKQVFSSVDEVWICASSGAKIMSPTKAIKIDPARICVLEKQNQWRGGGIKHSKITPGHCGDDQVVPHPTPRDTKGQPLAAAVARTHT